MQTWGGGAHLYTSDKIAKWMVWRAVQGQYGLLGLLSAYILKLKLLMRNMCKKVAQAKMRKCLSLLPTTSETSWRT
jgi:hypothetical protein